MKKPNYTWLLLLLLLVSIPSTGKPLDLTELEKLVPEELEERNTPGAVIAPGKGGKVNYLFTELYAAKKVR